MLPIRPERVSRMGRVENVFVPLQVLLLARRVEEAAVTVMFPEPSKEVPFIVTGEASFVAVPALPPMLSVEVETAYVAPVFNPSNPKSDEASVVAPVTARSPKV